jgi:hypothetical protein
MALGLGIEFRYNAFSVDELSGQPLARFFIWLM